MFIKEQTFSDEDTLLEMIFDFSLGEATPFINELYAAIDKELENNEAYLKFIDSITEEEEKEAVQTEERDIRLAESLMELFDTFMVKKNAFYGHKKGEHTLLYTIDLV